jgi:hypothetical protein
MATLPPGQLVRVSLADFFYEYTLGTERVYLLNGLSQNASFYIRQWPQFMKASNTKAIIKLSAYFSRRKATINATARDLVVGIRQIIAYVNAAHAQNLLLSEAAASGPAAGDYRQAAVARAALPASSMPPQAVETRRTGGLFGRIRQRLGI